MKMRHAQMHSQETIYSVHPRRQRFNAVFPAGMNNRHVTWHIHAPPKQHLYNKLLYHIFYAWHKELSCINTSFGPFPLMPSGNSTPLADIGRPPHQWPRTHDYMLPAVHCGRHSTRMPRSTAVIEKSYPFACLLKRHASRAGSPVNRVFSSF